MTTVVISTRVQYLTRILNYAVNIGKMQISGLDLETEEAEEEV